MYLKFQRIERINNRIALHKDNPRYGKYVVVATIPNFDELGIDESRIDRSRLGERSRKMVELLDKAHNDGDMEARAQLEEILSSRGNSDPEIIYHHSEVDKLNKKWKPGLEVSEAYKDSFPTGYGTGSNVWKNPGGDISLNRMLLNTFIRYLRSTVR